MRNTRVTHDDIYVHKEDPHASIYDIKSCSCFFYDVAHGNGVILIQMQI